MLTIKNIFGKLTQKKYSMIDKTEINQKDAFYFQWHFLEQCNLRCSHCYQTSYSDEKLDISSILKIAGIIDSAMGKWQKKGRVSLTGGEPFTSVEYLLQLLNFFEESNNFYWVGILSNGTLLTQEIVEEIKKFRKLREVQISLDGATPQSHDAIRGGGAFDKAISGIKQLKEQNIPTAIMFTLHKENSEEAVRIIDLAVDLEVDALTIERITPVSEDDKKRFYIEPSELKQIYEMIYEKKSEIEDKHDLKVRVSRPLWNLIDEKIGGFCPAGLSSLTIMHDGTLYPCRRLEIPLGNILHDGLYNIWYTSEVLWSLRNKNKLTGKCGGCENIHACGGCRAIAYTVNNDYMAEDPQCWKEEG